MMKVSKNGASPMATEMKRIACIGREARYTRAIIDLERSLYEARGAAKCRAGWR